MSEQVQYPEGSYAYDEKTGKAYVVRNGEWQEQPKYGTVGGALAAFMNGATLDWADEGAARIDQVTSLGDKNYRDQQIMHENAGAIYGREHPVLSGISRGAGTIIPAVASLIATRGQATPGVMARAGNQMLKPAVTRSTAGTFPAMAAEAANLGGMYGTVAAGGHMSAEDAGSPVEAAKNLALGAAVGMGTGVGVAGGVQLARQLREPAARLYEYVRQQVPNAPPPAGVAAEAPTNRAANQALTAIEDANMSPGAVRASVEAGRAAGVPTTIADVGGRPVNRILRGVRAVDPKAGNLIDDRLYAGMEGQQQRVADAVEQGMGVGPVSPGAQAELLSTQKKALARPLYEAANARGPLADPELMAILESKSSVYAPRHEQARRTQARTSGETVAPLFDENGKLLRPPTVKDIDMIKQGADDELWTNARGMSEAKNSLPPGAQRDLKLSVYGAEGPVQRTGVLAPEYARAREIYSGHTAQENAVQAGYEAVRKSPEELRSIIATHTTSPAEVEMFRHGVVAGVRKQLSEAADKADAANVVRSIFGWGKGSKREALRMLFPDDAAFARFEASMNAELNKVRSRQQIQGGSNTIDKAFDAENALGMGEDVLRASHGDFTGLGARVAERARRGADTRFDLADNLTSMYGDQASDFLKLLEEIQRRRFERAAVNRGVNATGALLDQTPEVRSRVTR